MIPPEIDAALTAISNAQTELFMVAYSLGSYTATSDPGKRQHDGLRRCALDASTAAKGVITAMEPVIRLGQAAERMQDDG